MALAMLLVTGCEMSSVDPDAEVTIGATVVAGDGTPLADHPVVLLTEPTTGDVLFGLPFGLGSLGLLCLAEDPPPPCDTRRRATTDGQGTAAFTVSGRETQGMLGDAARMTVSSRSPAGDGEADGPATTGAFVVRSEQVSLEPLPLIRAMPALSAAEGRAVVSWTWQAGSAMRGSPSTAELVFSVGQRPHWVAPGQSAIDQRILEDVPGDVGVTEQRRADGTIDDLTYRSELVPYETGAGAPASRTAACTIVTSDGGSVRVAPCPVTDGDLTEREPASLACGDAACTRAAGYVVDLGSPRAVELVVVRGCDGSCPLEVSGDGASWELVAELAGPYVAVTRAGEPVRYVRVTGDAGAQGLAEISVWDGPAAAPTFEVRTLPDAGAGATGGATAGGGDGSGHWLRWAAAALLVVALVGVGVALGRRST